MPPGIGIAAVAGVGCGMLLLVTPAISFEYSLRQSNAIASVAQAFVAGGNLAVPGSALPGGGMGFV